MDGTMSLNAYQFDQVKVRNNLAHMVILHEYLLSMVDHIGFRKFVGFLQPLFKLISRNTLKSDILKFMIMRERKLWRWQTRIEVGWQLQLICGLRVTKREGLWSLPLILSIILGRCKTGFQGNFFICKC